MLCPPGSPVVLTTTDALFMSFQVVVGHYFQQKAGFLKIKMNMVFLKKKGIV